MIQAGMEFGTNTPYGEYTLIWIMLIPRFFFSMDVLKRCCRVLCSGSALLRCGEAQKQLGEAEKKFVQSTNIHFLNPLRSFSEGEYKAIQVTDPDSYSSTLTLWLCVCAPRFLICVLSFRPSLLFRNCLYAWIIYKLACLCVCFFIGWAQDVGK